MEFCPANSLNLRQVSLHMAGDVGKHNSRGELTVVGRRDRQVKINGKRLELDEVEVSIAASAQECGVKIGSKIAVVAAGASSLEAFVTPGDVNVQILRQALKDRLPVHMVPAVITAMPKLPTLASGKVNYGELKKRASQTEHPAKEIVGDFNNLALFLQSEQAKALMEQGVDSLGLVNLFTAYEAKRENTRKDSVTSRLVATRSLHREGNRVAFPLSNAQKLMFPRYADALAHMDYADLPRDIHLEGLFQDQVSRVPDDVAIELWSSALGRTSASVTYSELNNISQTIADRLVEAGVGRGHMVGLLLDRGVHMIAATLALLKVGATVVNMEVAWPLARIEVLTQTLTLP